MIAVIQYALDDRVQGLGAAGREDDGFGRRRVKESRDRLSRLVDLLRCLQGLPITASAGIEAIALDRLLYRADHLRRLWVRGGGVVEIDHGFSRSALPRTRTPFWRRSFSASSVWFGTNRQ